MLDEKIRSVLSRHPAVTTIEDALDCCKVEGIEATFWSVYFVARDAGRKLTRRPPEPFGEDDLRELALILVGLHKDKKQALATLNKLQEMNDAGTRIDWPSEKTSAAHGWELSVAQELADYAGGIPQARQIVNSL
ncbi:MAG: hypothetical protein NT013_07745 [Planctomycetia bacterium]|nr:hypothetical protein [Planctomycetia bacterium]